MRSAVTATAALRLGAATGRPAAARFALYRRSFSSLPRVLASPPYVWTHLPSRALLSLTGPDATKLLQGLVSNDVRRLAQPGDPDDAPRQPVLYANLLKADGRYLHDVMLYPPPSTTTGAEAPAYLIEHDAAFTPTLRTYLKRHILRAKVKLGRGPEPDLVVTAAWRNPAAAEVGEGGSSSRHQVDEAEAWLESRGRGWDPRVVGMGYRWIATPEDETPPPELFRPVTPAHFHLHRLLHAVPEGPADFPALPLEANIDLMNGVDYRKGCYVGQELTARTHHKGVVRKRGVVFRLFREGEDIPTSPVPTTSSSSTSTPSALTPFPSLFPLPPPGSTLTPLRTSSSSEGAAESSSPAAAARRRARAPRPSGKLGSSICAATPSGGTTVALAYGSVRLDHLEPEEESGAGSDGYGVFIVQAPVAEDQVVRAAAPASSSSFPSLPTGEAQGREDDAVTETPAFVERGEGAGESQEEGGRWLARGFKTEWLEWKLEEEALSKGL